MGCAASKHASYDKSIIACCLDSRLDGKLRFERTPDWRQPPGPPRFPLIRHAEMNEAQNFAKNVQDLSKEDCTKYIDDLCDGVTPTIKWSVQDGTEGDIEDDDDFDFDCIGDDEAEVDDYTPKDIHLDWWKLQRTLLLMVPTA